MQRNADQCPSDSRYAARTTASFLRHGKNFFKNDGAPDAAVSADGVLILCLAFPFLTEFRAAFRVARCGTGTALLIRFSFPLLLLKQATDTARSSLDCRPLLLYPAAPHTFALARYSPHVLPPGRSP